MWITGLLALILTQSDKLIISRMLSLEQLGYYQIAWSIASWVGFIQGAFNSAALPSYAAEISVHRTTVCMRHNMLTQTTAFAAAIPAFLLIFFAKPLLALWIPSALAGAATSLSVLAGGFLLGSVVSNCHTIASAAGKSGLLARLNAITVALYLPILVGLTLLWGIEGAAWSWIAINAWYFVALGFPVQRDILGQSPWEWLARYAVPPLISGVFVFGFAAAAASWLTFNPGQMIALYAVAAVIYLAFAPLYLGKGVRSALIGMISSTLNFRKHDT
jgi:O-antigen/teichoic acid export membrane protein